MALALVRLSTPDLTSGPGLGTTEVTGLSVTHNYCRTQACPPYAVMAVYRISGFNLIIEFTPTSD